MSSRQRVAWQRKQTLTASQSEAAEARAAAGQKGQVRSVPGGEGVHAECKGADAAGVLFASVRNLMSVVSLAEEILASGAVVTGRVAVEVMATDLQVVQMEAPVVVEA